MKNSFLKIINNYITMYNTPYKPTVHDLARFIEKDFPVLITEQLSINSKLYATEGSVGQGKWTDTPWISVFDKDITTSAQKGFYIVYLFRKDMKGVYLSLNQGTKYIKKKYKGNKPKDKMKTIASNIRKNLTYDNHRFPLNQIDLKTSTDNGTNYMAAHICGKFYPSSNFPSNSEIVEDLPSERKYSFKSGVNIMYGCNNFCTYCIVPYVRGRERSRHPKDILQEVEQLAKEGYKEITLLGQNVNSYLVSEDWKGKGLEYKGINSFATLLREINKIDGIERIRFVSPHPKDFTDDVIEAIANCEKVCKLIHLPLQSGSSKVLKTMNRKYTKEQYLALVEKMKAKIPNLTLSTDIIVGFAGETEEDFEDTLDVVRKVCFEQVYMFIYSRRVGTPGDKMQNQVPEDIKHKRFDRLKELVESQIAKNNSKYVGTIQKVLVEGPSKNNPELLTGRTDSNKVVIFEGSKELIDTIIDLKIISEHMWYLKGQII